MSNLPAAFTVPLPTAALEQAAITYCSLVGIDPNEKVMDPGINRVDVRGLHSLGSALRFALNPVSVAAPEKASV